MRHTDRASESLFIVSNTQSHSVEETILLSDSKVMEGTRLVDQLGQTPESFPVRAALATVKVPPHTTLVLKPVLDRGDGYDPYKRVP